MSNPGSLGPLVCFSVPVISEATAKQALLDHVDAQCCWGKKTANGITTFTQLDSTTSYQVRTTISFTYFYIS